jgi:ABC-type branched-subunit amino acid transport system ATPase component
VELSGRAFSFWSPRDFPHLLGDRGYLMDKGSIRYQGTIEELRKNEEVKKKYFMI